MSSDGVSIDATELDLGDHDVSIGVHTSGDEVSSIWVSVGALSQSGIEFSSMAFV